MASFYAQTQLVQTSSTGNVIVLSGSGTTWSGSPFSVTGGSGASITAQSVSSTTAASITLSAGSSTGALTISDGTNTTVIYVESPAWSSVVVDNFTRANTSPGAAGTSTGAGNGWIDNHGSIYSISSNQLAALWNSTISNNAGFLNRPSSENHTDERMVLQFPFGGQASPVSWLSNLRVSGTGGTFDAYVADFANTVFYIFSYLNGTGTVVGTPVTGLTYVSGHVYQIDFSVWGTSPTNYLAILTDVTACQVLGVITGTNSATGVQAAGEYAIAPGAGASGTGTINFSAATTYQNIGTSVIINADNANLKYIGAGGISGVGASARRIDQCPGGKIIANLAGTQTCIIAYDMSNVSAYQNCDIVYCIDGQYSRVTLGSTGLVAVTFPTWSSVDTDAYFNHKLEIITESTYEFTGTNQVTTSWTTNQALPLFKGLQLDTGASLLPVTLPQGFIEFDGDSITASTAILGDSGGTYPPQDEAAHIGWPYQVAAALGLAPIMRGYPGGAVSKTNNGSTFTDQGVPLANANFPYSFATTPYVPIKAPAAVVVAYGSNDAGQSVSGATFQAAYTTYLATIRAAYPHAVIFCVVLPGFSTYLTNITASVAAAGPIVYLLNYSALSYTTTDTLHPDVGGAVTIAAQLAADIQTQFTALGIGYGFINETFPCTNIVGAVL